MIVLTFDWFHLIRSFTNKCRRRRRKSRENASRSCYSASNIDELTIFLPYKSVAMSMVLIGQKAAFWKPANSCIFAFFRWHLVCSLNWWLFGSNCPFFLNNLAFDFSTELFFGTKICQSNNIFCLFLTASLNCCCYCYFTFVKFDRFRHIFVWWKNIFTLLRHWAWLKYIFIIGFVGFVERKYIFMSLQNSIALL